MLPLLYKKSPSLCKNTLIQNGFKSASFLAATRYNSTKSICPAGTPLNLKIKVNQEEPVALEDSEYPEWLWKIMEEDKIDDKMSVEEQLKIRKRKISHDRKKEIRETIELLKNK